MAMFGALARKKEPFAGPEVYATPGIGDGLPGAPEMGGTGPGMATPAARPKKDVGDAIANAVINFSAGMGNPLGANLVQQRMSQQEAASRLAQQQQQYQQQRQDKREDWRTQADYEASQPQKVGDSIVRVDPATGAPEVIYRGEPQKTETERLIETWANSPDSDPRKGLIEASLRGAQYNPSIYQPMIDYKTKGQIAVKSATPGKAPSTARSGGPRSAPKPPAGFILD